MKINLLICILLPACVAAQPATKPVVDFSKAVSPRDWSFPRDHGRHDGYKLEWWYFTGNLVDSSGRKFGYQLTFFRSAFSPETPNRQSPWGMSDLYFAHFAVSDIQSKQFLFKDRMERARPGLAFASDQSMDVSLLNWSARMQGDTIDLKAGETNFAIDLDCSDGHGPVLQGPGGVNVKGPAPGEASYYYSITRLKTTGTITLNNQVFKVAGLSWMDHEFSSDAMAQNQVGWDWFGLQLKDGTDLMIYRMRSRDGRDDYLSGTQISASGQPRYLTGKELSIAGDLPWTSQASGASYPQRWKVRIGDRPELIVTTEMPGQELQTTASTKVTYFEGASVVKNAAGDEVGEGYLEMTGYAKGEK